MDTIKMTIHRALAELKLIDSRIEKGIGVIIPTGVYQEGKLVNESVDKDTFEKDVTAKYQSVTNLIGRKIKIKAAIVKANGITKVVVGGNKMTISDAITFKNVIALKKSLIQSLDGKRKAVLSTFTLRNEEVDKVALTNAQQMIGGENGDVKPTDDDVKAIVDPFVKRNKFHMSDPLGIDELIERLQKEVDDFEVDVDAVLSEINAITLIEI